MVARISLYLALLIVVPGAARGDQQCIRELREIGANFKKVRHRHIETAVEIRGALGGVYFESWGNKPFVVDCRLALALAKSERFFTDKKIVRARYSSAYSRRRIRRSGRWSRHSYGMAIDIHSFTRTDGTTIEVRNHYEQGLGDGVDCVGRPLTDEGSILRTLSCQFARSGLFDNVLDPDYDADHYNHFHLDVQP